MRSGPWRTLLLSIMVWLGSAVAAHATSQTVLFTFADPAWSATATFDDTTGVPWTFDSQITAYAVTSMLVTDGTATWDLSEATFLLPPNNGVLVDSAGRVALSVVAVDTTTSLRLNPGVGWDFGTFSETAFFAPDEALYTASVAPVPEPSTALFVTTGLLWLSIRRFPSRG